MKAELLGTVGATRNGVTNWFGNLTHKAVRAGATYVIYFPAKKTPSRRRPCR